MRQLRSPILVNAYERAVDADLARFCQRRGLRLLPKLRVADVLPVDNGWINGADKSYALRAHFDFVLADAYGFAELAIEFDGPQHSTDPVTIARDEKKARICRAYALPLVRIGAAAFKRVDEQRSFLAWLLEVWREQRELKRAWNEVHEADDGDDWDGDLPEEKVDRLDYRTYAGLADWEAPGRMISAPLDPFRDARKRIGSTLLGIFRPAPEGWLRRDGRVSVGYVAIAVGESGWLLGRGRADLSGLFPWVDGLCPPFVAQDIALLDVARQLDEWQRGTRAALSREVVQAVVADAKPMLLARIELPSRQERADFVLRTIKGWGVDTDDPLVQTRVWKSFERDPCGFEDPWDDL